MCLELRGVLPLFTAPSFRLSDGRIGLALACELVRLGRASAG